MRSFNSRFPTFVAVAALLAPPLAMGTDMVTALAVDARTPHTIYAGSLGGGVYRSTDGGSSWSQTGLTILSVQSFVVDLQTPSTVYAVANGGIFKSANRGQSWSGLNPPSDVAGVTALAIDPSNPSTLYAALFAYYYDESELLRSSGGVAKSTDGGTNWTSVSFPSGVLAIAIDPLDPTKLVAGTEQIPGWMGPEVYGDVFTSVDGGVTWNPSYMWWGSVYLAAAHAPPSTIYVVSSSNAVVNLSTGTVGYPLHAIGALAIDPHDPATVYVGTGNWVYKSTDAGFRWYQTSPQKNCLGDADCLVTALAIDAAGSEILYAGTSDGRVHKSTDGGVSWAAIGLTPPPVDTEAPDTTITSALDNRGNEIWNGGSTRSDMITFKFAGSDNNGITGFECSVDAAAFASCSSPRILNGISRGSHSFRVRAVDSRGFRDQSPGAFSWSRQ